MPTGAPPVMPGMPDAPPPMLGTWRNVYIFVLVYEVLVIASFYLFTRAVA
ncbi:MAG: hypothetical protein M3Z23_15650 [Acidobacteriota bacterium]|nr:hypothetical protein [Acidobacteriota bacterium]